MKRLMGTAFCLLWGISSGAADIKMQATPAGDEYGYLSTAKPGPLTLVFATDVAESLGGTFTSIPDTLSKAGFIVASVDLPCHGNDAPGLMKRLAARRWGHAIDYGLDCWARRVAEDKGDIFAGFILRVGRVITDLQARNVATKGRVIAVGVSRGGYLAFRLAISDPRITDVIALAPVTDLQRLREFAAVKVDESTYGLGRGSPILARKREFIQIGSNDDRVGTREVLRLVDGMAASAGAGRLDLTFLLEPLVGHATAEHERAAAWALYPSPSPAASLPLP